MARTDLAVFGGKPVFAAGEKKTAWPFFDASDEQALLAVLKEQLWASDAPQLQAFEKEWAAYSGAPHVLAASSGTASLHMALHAVGVQAGDEVIVPAYTFLATGLVVLHSSAIPVFADVNLDTYTLDPATLESRITERTKAIMPVHLFGLPAAMDEINAIARKHGIPVVEDAAQAHGAEYKGKKITNLADAAGSSINGAKNLLAGEGGIFTCQTEEQLRRAMNLGLRIDLNLPQEDKRYPEWTLGYGYRANCFGIAVARSQLKKIEKLTAVRVANGTRMTERLKQIPGVIPPLVPAGIKHCYHMFRVRFDPAALGLNVSARELRAVVVPALAAEGVPARSWMPWTLPDRPIFQARDAFGRGHPWKTFHSRVRYDPAEFPNAIRVVDETATIPDVPTAATPEIIDRIGEAFAKVMANAKELVRDKKAPRVYGACEGAEKILKRARRKAFGPKKAKPTEITPVAPAAP